jgi:hypothetical protein
MAPSDWFEDTPVLGAMSATGAAAKLRELGEDEDAEELLESAGMPPTGYGTRGGWSLLKPKPFQHTAHAFGYLAPAAPGSDLLPILHAGNMNADASLQGARLKITLDQLRVADYPGSGEHQVLFDFYAQNQTASGVEPLHFTAAFRAQEGQRVAAIGYPLFVGLKAGGEGVSFKCFTVNVKNRDDEAFLGFLESDIFKQGLKLVETAQPAVALFSQTALGLTKAIAQRNRNVPVQDFYMGLDFSAIATRARLKEGSYIAVQIPESSLVVWDWSQWAYNPNNGQIVNRADTTRLIPYNYLVIGVSRAA